VVGEQPAKLAAGHDDAEVKDAQSLEGAVARIGAGIIRGSRGTEPVAIVGVNGRAGTGDSGPAAVDHEGSRRYGQADLGCDQGLR
jgi:hypothetical protein